MLWANTLKASQVNINDNKIFYGPVLPVFYGPVQTHKIKKTTTYAKGTFGGQCVTFARNYLHITSKAFGGFAGRIKPNSQTPAVGTVVLTHNHAAIVQGIVGGELVLIESNWHLDQRITTGRHLAITDPTIRGYFQP